MAFLDDIKTILVSGGVNTSLIYKAAGPDDPNLLLVLTESEGFEGVITMQAGLVAEEPKVQVLARGAKNGYEAARVLAQQAYQVLKYRQQETVGSTTYMLMRAETPPFFIGYDSNERPMIVFNVRVVSR